MITRIEETSLTLSSKPNSIFFAGAVLVLMAGGLCRPASAEADRQNRPNILWIIAEDNGPEYGCYGEKLVHTPNVDRLAAEGARFVNAFTSTPVCSSSRSSFMTGMFATTIGAHNHRSHRNDGFMLPEGVHVFTKYLRDAGYFTAICGKGKTDWNFKTRVKPYDSKNWNDLKSHQPFFAQYQFSETHRRFKSSKEHPVDPEKVKLPPYYPDHPVARKDWALYLESINVLDKKIGGVLKKLEDDGLAENTIVFYFGDHGRAHVRGKQWLYDGGISIPLVIRWPGRITKGAVSDELVSAIDFAPTCLKLAGIEPPKHMQGRIFLGPDKQPEPKFIFATRDRCDETVDRIRCVRDRQYKYIRNFMPERPYTQTNRYKERAYPMLGVMKQLHAEGKLTPVQQLFMAPRRPEEEFYDLKTDPWEIRNLAGSPDHQETLKRMRETLEQWIADTDDQGRFPEKKAPKPRTPKKQSGVVGPTKTVHAVAQAKEFRSDWSNRHDRIWIGPKFWANPMEDWELRGGRLQCMRAGQNRNVHLLTRRLSDGKGTLEMSVVVGRRADNRGAGTAGFHIGIRSELGDYRSSLLRGSGVKAGITSGGKLFVGKLPEADSGPSTFPDKGARLLLKLQPENDRYSLSLTAYDAQSGEELGTVLGQADPKQLPGNIALVNNFGQPGWRRPSKKKGNSPPPPTRGLFWFSDWRVSGSKLAADESHAFGPILYAQHSLSRNVMKMTAQMPPMGEKEEKEVRLQIKKTNEGNWETIGKADIDRLSCTAAFRIENWDSTRNTPYRLVYNMTDGDGRKTEHQFSGTVRKDPIDRDTLVVAGFTGNTDAGFPNEVLARNVATHDPDVLLFTGDQIYEGVGGYGIHRKPVGLACLNYLRKIYLWGWAFREVMRDRVTLTLADDHDVYQGNIWGNGGNPLPSMREHPKGGYVMHKDFVNAVQRTLSSHHPDPYDPAPIKQGITVYYGDMVYGRVSFAVLEDRKFKSGPMGKVNTWKGRPDHVRDKNFDPKTIDLPGLTLLGERQLKFLRAWTADWRGADMKFVCSQTIFCNLANYHGGGKTYLVADLDSNGWPQTGRNIALREMRKGFAFHLAGDQHLASIVHHGVDTWNDAGYSFCVPSIAAGYPRAWLPDQESLSVQNRPAAGLPNTGEYRDGLGNRVTVHAVGNPAVKNRRPILQRLHDKASGYGLVRLNKKKRTITMECWRLLSDASDPKSTDQFPGWPKTIDMLDNYGRKAAAYLPAIKVQGMTDPVVQIINEATGETVYTLRIKGTSFTPKVFKAGTYTLRIGDPDDGRMKVFKGISSRPRTNQATLEVRFN